MVVGVTVGTWWCSGDMWRPLVSLVSSKYSVFSIQDVLFHCTEFTCFWRGWSFCPFPTIVANKSQFRSSRHCFWSSFNLEIGWNVYEHRFNNRCATFWTTMNNWDAWFLLTALLVFIWTIRLPPSTSYPAATQRVQIIFRPNRNDSEDFQTVKIWFQQGGARVHTETLSGSWAEDVPNVLDSLRGGFINCSFPDLTPRVFFLWD